MDLKELKKLAGTLDDKGKQELIFFLQSRSKGVLIARDHQKMTYSGVLGRGRIRTTKSDEAIGGHLSDSNVLCTASWRAFSSYANAKGLIYGIKSDGKQRVKGVNHIQHVNSYHSRLKKWMDRFNGVATKYLQHYLA